MKVHLALNPFFGELEMDFSCKKIEAQTDIERLENGHLFYLPGVTV